MDEKKSKFLDVSSNAKSVGFIIFIIGLIKSLGILPALVDSNTYRNPIYFIISVVVSIGLIVFGLALRKLKKWAMYGFIGLSILAIVGSLLNFLSGIPGSLTSLILNLAIYGGLSFWFYSARAKFN